MSANPGLSLTRKLSVLVTALFIGLAAGVPSGVQAASATHMVVTLPNQVFVTGLGNIGSARSQTAGANFNLTLTAIDDDGKIAIDYDGTKSITYSGPGGSPIYTTDVTFILGQATSIPTTLTLAQTITVIATDGALAGNASSSLVVNPGQFAALQLLLPGETALPGTASGKSGSVPPQNAGRPFTVKVNAVDANWNLVNTVAQVAIASSDPDADLPTNAPLNGGVANLTVTLRSAGPRTLAATNITDAAKSSTAAIVTVVSQQPQTITFNPLSDQVYGAPAVALSASTSSGLPVNFSVLSGPATLNGTNLSITGVGTVVVQASQAGDTNFFAATNVAQSFNVSAAVLTVSSPNQSRFVGQTNPAFAGTVSGLQYSDSITAAFNVGATTNSPIGNYPIVPSLADPGNRLANYVVTTNGILSVNPLAVQWTTDSGGNGHYFQAILMPGGISWDEASLNATNAGGYLATLTSSNKNDFVFSLISNTPDYWIPDSGGGDGPWVGGIRLGPLNAPANPTNWTWVTGEAFIYNNWAWAQPNNINGYQDHIQFYSRYGLVSNTWNDAANIMDAEYVPGYIIEYDSNPYAPIATNPPVTENFTGVSPATNGHVVLHFSGVAARTYSVQASTDLQNWITIGSATADANGLFDYEDVEAAAYPQRFYRTSYP